MTVQYLGNELYKMDIGYQTFSLSKDEIDEIQRFDFERMKNFDKSIEDLEDELKDLSLKYENLSQQLSENFEFLQENVTSDVFDEDSFDSRTKNIYEILDKMQGKVTF